MGAKTITRETQDLSKALREQNARSGASATSSVMARAFYVQELTKPKQVRTLIRLNSTTAHK